MNLYEKIAAITPPDARAAAAAKRRWDSIAKPLCGMGMLETCIEKIAGIDPALALGRKCVAVMCADNGIVAEGVTQTGSEVTAIVAGNIARGQATVANMARVAGADVFAYDVGMLTEAPGVSVRKSCSGTKNFRYEPAMTRAQAEAAIETGMDIAGELKAQGYGIIASGEMGIGNTTTSSAIAAVLLGVEPRLVTGKGAGLSAEGVSHKAQVIAQAIALHQPNPADPIDVLCKVGGFDIAALCGLFLGGAYHGVPVVIDGLISSVAALLAVRLCPHTSGYLLASHTSAEPAAAMLMEQLHLCAPLQCGMALGEGTGAVALFPLLDMALAVYRNMPTFGDVEIEEYKPL